MTQTPPGTDSRPLVGGARYGLVALAFLFGVGAVLQIFLAGLSLFESAEYWSDHVDFGMYLGIPALLIPVAAAIGRVGRQLLVMSIGVTVLFFLQIALANVDNGFIGALHALNAFAVTSIAFQTGLRSLARVRSEAGYQGDSRMMGRSVD